MKLARPVLLALALPLALAACSKKSGAPKVDATETTGATTATKPAAPAAEATGGVVFSCKSPDIGLCSEWRGLGFSELADAKASCNDPGEVFSSKPCATAGVIATCENPEEKIKLFISRSAAVGSLKDAKEMCDDGKFTALVR